MLIMFIIKALVENSIFDITRVILEITFDNNTVFLTNFWKQCDRFFKWFNWSTISCALLLLQMVLFTLKRQHSPFGLSKAIQHGPLSKKKANLPSEKRKCNLYTVAGESKKERVGIRGKFSQRKLITGTILSFGLNFWQSFDCFVKHDQIFLTTEALLWISRRSTCLHLCCIFKPSTNSSSELPLSLYLSLEVLKTEDEQLSKMIWQLTVD